MSDIKKNIANKNNEIKQIWQTHAYIHMLQHNETIAAATACYENKINHHTTS